MNIFELRGPDFLFVYFVLTVIALAITWVLRRALDGAGVPLQSPASLVSDPYLIAQLRGGAGETVRVAAMSLMDRGLIDYEGGELKTKGGASAEHGHRPIEREVLRLLLAGGNAQTLSQAKSACEPYEQRLQSLQLVPDGSIRMRRGLLFFVMLLLLGGTALIKIFIGLSRGRPVLFLVILSAAAVILLFKTAMTRRTKHGDALLADIRRLFSGLQRRAESIKRGGATSELALLAAVFGLTAVPVTVFPHRSLLFPQPAAPSSSSSDWSSSSSSCGSSCGGGCGGGCGGCGS